MKDVMKKRVVGAVVLVMIGILIPLLLVRCLHGGGADSDSMRVYEITPEGDAQRADAGDQAAETDDQAAPEKTQMPAQENVDGATGVPQRDGQGGDEQARPEAISPNAQAQSMQTPPVAGNQKKQASSTSQRQAPAQPSPKRSPNEPAQSRSLRKSDSSEGWVVQVASFGDEDNARRLAQELSGDFHAFYRAGDVGDKTYYRVRVGPFDSEDAARSAATKLRQRGRSTLVRRSE